MNDLYADSKAVEALTSDLDGVFCISDLRNLLNTKREVELHRRIRRLQSRGVLRRFCRSIYVTQEFSLEALSCRINPDSYITCGSVLSLNLLIGSIPSRTVTAAKPGRNRQYLSGFGNVVQLSIARHLLFGVEFAGGIRRANSEKAFLDTLYFHQKGHKFSFDIYSDINLEFLDMARVREYLARYRNPKFVRFVENVLGG